ncbi:hypothetical protein DAI22_11g139100 [Oryza sativa Japonica Group]|nr:hypothetical protein DAI22_11g139100 [Oryza sativa Japonica Group]
MGMTPPRYRGRHHLAVKVADASATASTTSSPRPAPLRSPPPHSFGSQRTNHCHHPTTTSSPEPAPLRLPPSRRHGRPHTCRRWRRYHTQGESN